MSGEEVLGNSGSFRHIMSALTDQLHSPLLNLLVPYTGTGGYTGRFYLKPGPTNFGEEKMLQFFGQLLGMSLRSGIPLALNMMPTFWRALVNEPMIKWEYCSDIDPVSTLYLQTLEQATRANFDTILEEYDNPTFTYLSIAGKTEDLCQDGGSIDLTFENREEYIRLIKDYKLREWRSQERMDHIAAGLASMAPLHFIQSMYSAKDAEQTFCGLTTVDLNFLKQHTIYQVGISEQDPHVVNFWAALGSFSQPQLEKFIKFACNQDRIPMRGQDDSGVHVPPYPMKLAPPDVREGDPDCQMIRVETCMFMIKLPKYTSITVMKEKLLYAISCASDPLSG